MKLGLVRNGLVRNSANHGLSLSLKTHAVHVSPLLPEE